MRNETLEAGACNCSQNRRIAQFLAKVQVVAARIAAAAKVCDRSDRALDRADHVALHNLHVINVLQLAHARCIRQPANLQPPVRAVRLVTGMVYAAVEQLQQQRHAGCRCCA